MYDYTHPEMPADKIFVDYDQMYRDQLLFLKSVQEPKC